MMTEETPTEAETSSSSLRQTILISLACSLLTVLAYALVFQPIQLIEQNKQQIELQQQQLAEIKESVQVSREALTNQMQLYIDENYGDISERDENIAKLLVYFKQQDARLSNIEEALAQF